MIEISILLFSIGKIVEAVPTDVFGFIFVFTFVFLLLIKSSKSSLAYIFVVLSNSTYALLVANAVLVALFIFVSFKNNRINSTFVIINILFAFLLIQSVFNYKSIYDILRWFVLYFSWTLLFTMPLLADDTYKKKIPFIFLSLLVANFLYLTFLSDNYRMSIFSGSENIALMIFFVMSMIVVKLGKYRYLIFLPLFLFYMDSRTIFVIPTVYILLRLFVYKGNRFKSLIFSLFLSFSFFCFVSLNPEARISEVVSDSTQLLYAQDLTDLEKIDSRGFLLVEGIGKFKDEIWFGHGVIKPDFFKIYEPDIKMATYHNVIIDLLVTYGLTGSIIVFLIIYLNLKYIFVNFDLEFFVIILTCLVSSIIQPYFFNIQVISMIFSLSLIFNRKVRDE